MAWSWVMLITCTFLRDKKKYWSRWDYDHPKEQIFTFAVAQIFNLHHLCQSALIILFPEFAYTPEKKTGDKYHHLPSSHLPNPVNYIKESVPLCLPGQYLLQCGRRRRRRRRHGGRTGLSDRRAMEEDPTEHVHQVGQWAPEDHRSDYPESGDGSLRWTATDRLDRGAVPETYAEAQQATYVPQSEAGERLGCA